VLPADDDFSFATSGDISQNVALFYGAATDGPPRRSRQPGSHCEASSVLRRRLLLVLVEKLPLPLALKVFLLRSLERGERDV
jgi:hypothetical protein